MALRKFFPDTPLGEPQRDFDATFSASEVVHDHFFKINDKRGAIQALNTIRDQIAAPEMRETIRQVVEYLKAA